MFAIFAISAGSHLHARPDDEVAAARLGGVGARWSFLFLAGVTIAYWAEARGNPLLAGTDQTAGAMCPGGNMEGKEARFGIANSALFATVTTDASCGAVNAMHDSFTPLGGMVPLVNIMLGEVIFGGVGAGMYGILIFVVLSVFIAGLMVGRTPEYLGKKIEAFDVQMAMLAVLVFPLIDPGVHGHLGRSRRTSARPASPTRGRTACPRSSTPTPRAPATTARRSPASRPTRTWYNTTLGIAMLVGRFLIIVPMLALAGNLGRKKQRAAVARHLPGDDAAVRRRCSSA